jgi:hypothetical protein
LDKPNVFNTLFNPLQVQQFQRYLPTAFDEGMTLLEKMNKIIIQLNRIGKLSNDVLDQWNQVMDWVMSDGLDETVSAKLDSMILDGSFNSIINEEIFGGFNNDLNSLKNDIVNLGNFDFNGVNMSSIQSGQFTSQRTRDLLSYWKDLGGNTVAIVATWYQDTATSTAIYRDSIKTIPDSDVSQAIRTAKAQGYKVVLKPHVDVQDGSWRGDINPTDWTTWFSSYQTFINAYAQIARNENVDLFVVGTELRFASRNTTNWQTVINSIKTIYNGKLTYAANASAGDPTNGLDEYASIAFWNILDYIGIDCYFPMTSYIDPSIDDLNQAWSKNLNGNNLVQNLLNVYTQYNKPVIFTEIGMASVQGANISPANLPQNAITDYTEQSNYVESFFQVFLSNVDWFKGFLWWRLSFDSSDIFTMENKPSADSFKKYLLTSNVKISSVSKNAVAGGSPILTIGNHVLDDLPHPNYKKRDKDGFIDVYSTTDQTVQAGVSLVNFPTIAINYMGDGSYDPSKSMLTIKREGSYTISAGLRLNNPSVQNRSIKVYVNGSYKRRLAYTDKAILMGTQSLYLYENDEVLIYIDTPDSVTISNNGLETFLVVC